MLDFFTSPGIGKETAKALLAHNATVYLAARNENKTKQAIADLKQETGKEGIFLELDLSDLRSVKRAAEEYLRQGHDLHVLFNNAGVMGPPIDHLTKQGYDAQFGTNVLGHFYFTKLLLPALLRGAKSSPDGKARVVNTSSSTSLLVNGVDFNTFKDSPARLRYSSRTLYSQSKLGNVLFSNALARRYGDKGIVSTSLNPGNLDSEIRRHGVSWGRRMIGPLILYPSPLGALTQLWAGTSSEGATLNGKYLIPWARVGNRPNPAGYDEKLQDDLWDWMEEQVKDL
ncbi:hypothetical protein CVT24_010668 [Panaeolus cyanescens]|uniref:NAD(P)-binding protein n=1 Tax=Panaeolus cyanescens TaxID=181874 RepID=A0A409YM48_9AGAR|nr:hypothetical protein CVT24_010668 [Panaeolus cyanescens]